MSAIYLHDRPDFEELLRTIEGETGILIQLIEKDYWINQSTWPREKKHDRLKKVCCKYYVGGAVKYEKTIKSSCAYIGGKVVDSSHCN